ncbi:ExbD/TolR family protein [Sphingoaurantiacus capsulatus]|uniref:ExbD/TolR family protein n=1 Tax=Sphingoaurantiacus capsulatus TaxID=1771310 RepID=A0ABV7XEF5_9SPHN
MAMSTGDSGSGGGEMVDINTTPLIDVMLVLLIMFIITIPIQTHAVKLDLPSNQQTPPTEMVDPVINRLEIDFLNDIYWNQTKVTEAQVRGYLKQAAEMDPQPELHLKPDALARYEIVNRVMADAQKAGVTKMGFVGNEAYAQ